jgi:hypothetical protein
MSQLNEYLSTLRAAGDVSEWRSIFQEYIGNISLAVSDHDYLKDVNEAYSTASKFTATGSEIEKEAVLGSINNQVYDRWVTLLNNR